MIADPPRGLAAALADLAARREPSAWAAVLVLVGEDLRRVAARLVGPDLADDAVQEALLRVREDAGSFRAPRGADADDAARHWAVAVTAHAALNLVRSRTRSSARAERAAAAHPTAPTAGPGESIERAETAQVVRDALAQLPPAQGMAISLRYLHDADLDEIATALGVPHGTVKSHLHRGLERLRGLLERRGIAGAAVLAGISGLDAGEAGSSVLADAGALLSAPPAQTPAWAGAAHGTGRWLLVAAGLVLAGFAGLAAWTAGGSSGPRPQPAASSAAGAPMTTDDRQSAAQLRPGIELQSERPPGVTDAVLEHLSRQFAAQAKDGNGTTWISTGTGGAADLAPSFARPGPGERILVDQLSDPTMARHVRLIGQDGRRRLVAWDADGRQIAAGPVDTPAERAALPEAVTAMLGSDFRASGRLDADLEALAAQAAAAQDQPQMLFTLRDGRPWLHVEQVGAVQFDGPVGTRSEREAIPIPVLMLLGDDFKVHGMGGPDSVLQVTTGSGTPGPSPVPQ